MNNEKYEAILETVKSIKGTTFAGLNTYTSVALKGGKKNPQQGRVTKRTTDANVILFSNTKDSGYVSMVRNRMIAEGKDPDTFEAKPRAWGKRIDSLPFIEHNDKIYLECFFVSPGKTVYYLDGVEIDKSEIEGLEISKEKSETEQISQGGIENKVVVRTFALDSIETIKLKGIEIHA